MAAQHDSKPQTTIRPVQYWDLDAIVRLATESAANNETIQAQIQELSQQIGWWHTPLKLFRSIGNSTTADRSLLVAEIDRQVRGVIKVSPFNRTHSTWKIDWVLTDRQAATPEDVASRCDLGSQLLRYCFENIIEASTWVLEVDVNDNAAIALYRHNGFQPLAHLTDWEVSSELLQELAQHEPDLPNLLPVRNTDAQLIYQLDTVAMPPLLRQVFDRQIHDFKTNPLETLLGKLQSWLKQSQTVSNYVFETQRKAAIGYYRLDLDRTSDKPNRAELTVHPAYTWLYPELMAQMARSCCQYLPQQRLQLVSADYQPEREEYLQQIGAQRIGHSLLMSRSVWHKLREAKQRNLDHLQLAEMLQSLGQPARQPLPNRIEKNDPEE
jgi:RimJ/RimL family protein N-acetyltransferase